MLNYLLALVKKYNTFFFNSSNNNNKQKNEIDEEHVNLLLGYLKCIGCDTSSVIYK